MANLDALNATPKFLQGPKGEQSSKRLYGAIMISAGGVLLIAMGIYGFFAVPPGIEAIKYSGLTLIAVGAGLLGFGTLAERIGR